MTTSHAQAGVYSPNPVDGHWPASVVVDTMSSARDESGPGRQRLQPPTSDQGLAEPRCKRRGRLMSMMPDPTDPPPARADQPVDSRGPNHPRPAICPLCGLTADNGIVVRNELVASATYVDTNAHLFAVTWVEVAA